MPTICWYCEAQNPTGTRTCPGCGVQLANAAVSRPALASAPVAPLPASASEPQGSFFGDFLAELIASPFVCPIGLVLGSLPVALFAWRFLEGNGFERTTFGTAYVGTMTGMAVLSWATIRLRRLLAP